MLPSAYFHNVVTVYSRDLSEDDPMSSSTDYEEVETVFCMVSQSKQKPIEVGQYFALQMEYKFTMRGKKSFNLGTTRFSWNGEYFEPCGMTVQPGINRNEDLTYVYVKKISSLTA